MRVPSGPLPAVTVATIQQLQPPPVVLGEVRASASGGGAPRGVHRIGHAAFKPDPGKTCHSEPRDEVRNLLASSGDPDSPRANRSAYRSSVFVITARRLLARNVNVRGIHPVDGRSVVRQNAWNGRDPEGRLRLPDPSGYSGNFIQDPRPAVSHTACRQRGGNACFRSPRGSTSSSGSSLPPGGGFAICGEAAARRDTAQGQAFP